jgi:hypothetical protein
VTFSSVFSAGCFDNTMWSRLFNLYKNKIVEDRRKVNGQGIRITQNSNVSTLLYGDDQVFLNETEDDLGVAHILSKIS